MKKTEAEILVNKLKKHLSIANKDNDIKEGGYLISYQDLEKIVNHIKMLRMASGRKP